MTDFETKALDAIKNFLIKGIENYDRYNNPLYELINKVIQERSLEIRIVLQKALTDILSGDFKAELRKIIAQKVVREIANQTESVFSRTIQKLKQDETFRARLIIAIDNLLKDYEK